MINLKLLTTIAILAISTIMPALAFAVPEGTSSSFGANWDYVNGNSWAQNFNPQTQINADNVDALEVKWIFPLQPSSIAPEGLSVLSLADGSTTPPIVHDGRVFITTGYLRTYAINATTGAEEWTNSYDLDVNATRERLPILRLVGGFFQRHLHGIRFWDTGNAVILAGMACDMYGIDYDTGETSFWIQDLCQDIPGNIYQYRQGAVSQTNIGTWEAGNQFIFVLPGSQHSSTQQMGDFRHTTVGIDYLSHNIIWRIYSFPAHAVNTEDWALQECDIGFFRDIPCSSVEAQARDALSWDWTAADNEPPHPVGGVTANWGEIVVDEDTGLAYTNTGNQGPYTYIGLTRGPRLYGSTLMAIDLENGVRKWWNQPMPRDPYDYDCNWSGVLAEDPSLGKVYIKGCKEGFLQILDAATGEPHHLIDVAVEMEGWGQTEASANEWDQSLGYKAGVKFHTMDPFSHYDMKEMVSPDRSPYCADKPQMCTLFPNWGNGLFGTDYSYDPQTNTIFHYAMALQRYDMCTVEPSYPLNYESRWEEGQGQSCRVSTADGRPSAPSNTSIVARDVTTGDVKWRWYYDTGTQRSHMLVTPTLVISAWRDGFVRFHDSESGALLREMNLGRAISVGMTMGKDDQGNTKFFTLFSGGGRAGTLLSFGLNPKTVALQASTVTSTSTTTATTTATSTTTETSVTTSVSVSTAPAQTSTVTSSVTEEVGLSSTITYAAVAVAVIAIIAAAVLYTRKQ